MNTTQHVAPVLRGALLGALATVVLLSNPDPGTAQGAGTRYFACRDQAWADYNTCLSTDWNSKFNQFKCFVAWDLDNVSCNIELIAEVI